MPIDNNRYKYLKKKKCSDKRVVYRLEKFHLNLDQLQQFRSLPKGIRNYLNI